LTSEQQAELAQLADEQARLTELLAGLLAVPPASPGPVPAEAPPNQIDCADDDARDSDPVRDEAVEPPPAPVAAEPSADPAQLVAQTIALMRAAHDRLAAEQLDDETSRLQQQIEEQLAQLLKLAEAQAARQPQVVPDEQPPDSAAGPASPAGGTGAQQDRTANAGESTETPRPGDELTADEIQRRKDLATAVWGHLPPRMRDRMHGAFSERFLPQYDDLVRRYYEALATQGDQEP
jgi:hypothetical protein